MVVAVVVTWRSPGITLRLIRHLVHQWPTMPIVLVECGPEGHDVGGIDHPIVVLRPGNLGYAGGNNLGIRHALAIGATHVLVLNSDAFPLPGCVESLLHDLDGHPGAGLLGATLIRWDPATGAEINRGTSFDWRTGQTAPAPSTGQGNVIDFACGAALLFDAKALRDVGAFDARLFLFYEEIDWAERARCRGYSVYSSPHAQVLHLGSRSVAAAPRAITFYRARNRLVVLRRYGRRHGCPLSLSRELRYAARIMFGHLLRGRLRALVPVARGTLHGFRAPLAVDEEPAIALGHQRWETRDQP